MEARPRLERVEADVMGNFKRLGVPCEPMDGRARLALLHGQLMHLPGQPGAVPAFQVGGHPRRRGYPHEAHIAPAQL